jgi:hypothetical protein
MRVADTQYGLRLLRDDRPPIDVVVIYDDAQRGTWLLVGTEHDAVEVRVTPRGRSVAANDTELRPWELASAEEDSE